MASSIQLKAAASPSISCSYQNDDDLSIGQITRSVDVEHILQVECDLVWRDEWTIATLGAENMDTDALTGNWCGSAISINFTTIYAVVIEVEKLASAASNDITLSVTGGGGAGTFPLVGSTLNCYAEGMTILGSAAGWTCGTTLVIVVTNGHGVESRTVRALIAGDL